MVLYAYELDKVLFRIERAGFVVYSVLSVREYANYHGLELRFAKGLMVITQLAELKRGGTLRTTRWLKCCRARRAP